jgi:hypothetical protein
MTNFETQARGALRMQPILGACIFILGTLSFGPLVLSSWGAREADAQTRVETDTVPSYSMTWVVDPDTPGKVKLAVQPRTASSDSQADTVARQP